MMIAQTIRAGTRIELQGTPAYSGFPGVAPEHAVIGRWTDRNGPIKNHVYDLPGWHLVKFADGGKLIVHESGFRIIDNR